MNMAVEKYIAAAGLGLCIMFIIEIITVYNFMIEPKREIEPTPKILQFISIGAAPASILIGIAFIMSKQFGSKLISYLILSSGSILLIGMIIANEMTQYIEKTYLVDAVLLTPIIFIFIAIAIIIIGIILLFTKEKEQKRYF